MPRLLLIRHGVAETPKEAAVQGRDEANRRLTDDGRRDMRVAARGLRELLERIDALTCSPLERARDTAAIVGKAFGCGAEVLAALTPGSDRAAIMNWLCGQNAAATCAVVGHEPDLGQLASWLLTGRTESRLTVKKAAALLLDFRDEAAPGAAELAWSLPPKVLRRLGGR